MAIDASPEFIAIGGGVAKTGQPYSLTVRQLLNHFGCERRGREVTRSINYRLSRLNLDTDPKFDQVHIEGAVKIIPRPKRPRGRPRKYPINGTHADSVSTSVKLSGGMETPAAETIAADEEEAEELRRPYLTIGLLASANRKPDLVRSNDKLEVAITLMLMHKISYIPVMQSERNAEGMVTWRSIGQARAANRETVKVSDCMDPVRVLPQSAPLFDAVRDIIRNGAVLVQAQDKTICGLVTAEDIAEQFVELSEPFLFLEQIENHLRNLLRKAKLNVEELRDIVDPTDAKRKQEICTEDGLQFGEYLRGLERPEIWERLRLGIDRNLFIKRMAMIREIRNNVMHFHPDGISHSNLEALSKTREMLQKL